MTAPALVGVVVPARDEEELLPACLAALRAACAHPRRRPTPVLVVVVADGCTDGTEALAVAAGVAVVRRDRGAGPGNVGAARAAGARWLLDRAAAAGVVPERLWLATTDADSAVPPDWLVVHEAAALAGADALVGTVLVDDWRGTPPHTAAAWRRNYDAWRDAGPDAVHPHVHGAHLGVRGSAYLACGGFPEVPVDEDVGLVRALDRSGVVVLRSPAGPVRTSARRSPRARGGFGDTVERLSTGGPVGDR